MACDVIGTKLADRHDSRSLPCGAAPLRGMTHVWDARIAAVDECVGAFEELPRRLSRRTFAHGPSPLICEVVLLPLIGNAVYLGEHRVDLRLHLCQQAGPPGCLLRVGGGQVKVAGVFQNRSMFER